MKNNNESKVNKSGQKKWISNPIRMLIYSLCALVISYVFEFVWVAVDKGQTQKDYAWEVIAHETLVRQHHGIPQMRIGDAGPVRSLCEFWNFEAIWGRCITIAVEVRDYKSEYQKIVEQEIGRFVDQMRTPCHLISTLALENKSILMENIGCNGWRKDFRFRVWVNSVTVAGEKGPLDRPNRWSLNSVKHLYTTVFFEGEL